jgi:2'-5' RNA ligase
VRAFVAVPADAAWRRLVQGLVARCKPELPRASWVKPEALHLTLKFLGDVSTEAAGRFAEEVQARVTTFPPGDLAASGPVLFPSRARPRVAGIGFAPGPALDALRGFAARVEAAARRIGVEPEDRTFSPHVTLARLRDPWPPAALEAFCGAVADQVFPVWPVRSVVLYESRLDPAGAVHAPWRQWPLAAAGVGNA